MTGHWSGTPTIERTAVTDEQGRATFTSDPAPDGGDFTFTVTNVAK